MSVHEIEERLYLHVDRLAGLIGPRVLSKPTTITATLGYLRGQWREMGYQVADETFPVLDATATNLVVEQAGTSHGDEIILLGAHYDTVPETPGADDNASAVAVLLEVSRLLKDHMAKRTARYVAFACEEPPYFNFDEMGSQYHARQAKRRGDKIKGMLCLEMVGYFQDEEGSQPMPPGIPRLLQPLIPRRGDFLAAVGDLRSGKLVHQFRDGFRQGTQLPLLAFALPKVIKVISLSDHRAFWEQGYPALMLTDTAFVRNPNYHLASDTPDTLDYRRMAEVTLGVATAMRRLLK